MGYLLKDTDSEELVAAIQAVHQGYSHLGLGLVEKAIAPVPDAPAEPPQVKNYRTQAAIFVNPFLPQLDDRD